MKTNRKSFDSIFSENSLNSENNVLDEIETAIKSLLFYKIEMPAGNTFKAILYFIEIILSKLDELKNCNFYMVLMI